MPYRSVAHRLIVAVFAVSAWTSTAAAHCGSSPSSPGSTPSSPCSDTLVWAGKPDLSVTLVSDVASSTGALTVREGTLTVDGASPAPSITLAASTPSIVAALIGTGSVDALFVENGTVKPGNASNPTGTLHVAGDVGFNSNSILAITVGSNGASQLAVSGAASVAGTVVATPDPCDVPEPAAGSRHAILTATGGVTGRFGGLLLYGLGATPAFLTYGADTVYLQFGPERGVIARSVTQLVQDRQGQMITGRILASVLLGTNEQISCNSACVSTFGAIGSVQAGVHGRAAITDEFSLIGGLAWSAWDSGGASSEGAPMFAVALRWDPDGFGASRPYAELGLTTTPWGRSRYSRSYDVGGTTYTGHGSADTQSLAISATLGWVTRLAPTDEVAASVELWRGWMRTGAYTEASGADNPLPASYGTAIDRTNVVRGGGQWTHLWGREIETQINLGLAGSFGSQSGVKSTIAGYGEIVGATKEAVWGEYGLRVGWRVNRSLVVDVFADGTLGGDPVGNTIHGGFGLRHAF